MRGFSKAIITGNLTRDPELRTTTNGTAVCSFAVAVNRTYRDANGEQKEDVSFIDCSAWSHAGEIINQYAKKGTGILVCGRLSQRSWEDKDGKKRSRVEVVVEDFNFMNAGPASGERSGNYGGGNFGGGNNFDNVDIPDMPASSDADSKDEISLDEIPF